MQHGKVGPTHAVGPMTQAGVGYLVGPNNVDSDKDVSHCNHPHGVTDAEDDIGLYAVAKSPVASN